MSEKTGISTIEEGTTKLEDLNKRKNFKYILACKCGVLHDFFVNFKKEYFINFQCDESAESSESSELDESTEVAEVKLSEWNESKKFAKKCKGCRKEIAIGKDYCEITDTQTIFICNNCKSIHANKKLKLSKISDIISMKDDEDDFRKRLVEKISNFIQNNGSNKESIFYQKNLDQIELLKDFINYLFLLKKLFIKGNIIYKKLSNCLNYFDHLLDIASNNILIYDLYHFNKEFILYSYGNEENFRFLSKDFKAKYMDLLYNCKKKKYLSLKMLKYIYSDYAKRKLASLSEKKLMKAKYFKNEEKNIDKMILREVSKIYKKFTEYNLIFTQLNQELETTQLRADISKLKNELNLDKYLNSYFNAPSQFTMLRKSVNLILDKIIKNNLDKLKFIKPNLKTTNLALDFVGKIKFEISFFDNNKVANSIMEKLEKLISELNKYKNSLEKKSEKEKKDFLIFPIINLKDEERNFLKENLEKTTYVKNIKTISVSNEEDKELDFVINYCFELKDITSKTIHINKKEYLKFYSFNKEIAQLPIPNKDDNLDQALDKIKEIIEIVPKYDQITYVELIDFLFNEDKKKFLKKDDKVSFLLTFLNLKLEKLKNINETYKTIKNKIISHINKIKAEVEDIKLKSDKTKFNKFINKYKIKSNSENIFEYLDHLANYAIPIFPKNEKEEIKEGEDSLEIKQNNFIQKEKELRKNIIELYKKDPKFITNISNYIWTKLVEYINNDKANFKKKLNFLEKNNMEKNLLSLKLEQLEEIILSYQLYNFNIYTHFNNFAENYEEILPNKKAKISETVSRNESIISFNNFIKKLKSYIGDANEKVLITNEEPGQFVFNLFLKQIGLNWE